MCLSKIIVKFLVPKIKIEKFDNFIFVGPHPDDIEIACGATVSKLIRLGKNVHFIIATDGSLGSNDVVSKEDLKSIRKNEAIEASKVFGVKSISFLDFSDGGQYTQEDINEKLYKKIVEIGAEIVFTPDPTLFNELHPDHIKVANATGHAALMSGLKLLAKDFDMEVSIPVQHILYYYTDKPNFYIKTKKEDVFKQISALSKHESQVNQVTEGRSNMSLFKLLIKFQSKRMGLKRLSLNAEGYRLSSTIQWHCFNVK